VSRERPRGRLESPIVREAIESLGSFDDLVLWRIVPTSPPDPITGRVFHCAPTGFADYVGIIAPAGRWCSLEFKRERGGRLLEFQKMHRDLVRRMGGFAADDLRSAEDARAAIERARRGALRRFCSIRPKPIGATTHGDSLAGRLLSARFCRWRPRRSNLTSETSPRRATFRRR
jgi:hypothetical protein